MHRAGWALLWCLSATGCRTGAGAPPAATPAASTAPDSASMADAVNAFGLDLYRSLAAAHPGKAILFSPYSIATALGMATEGARGGTAAEMSAVLHLPAAADVRRAELMAFKKSLGGLADTLPPPGTKATPDSPGSPEGFSVVHALWVDRTYPLAEPYTRVIDACYDPGSARPADFRGNPDGERIRINRWVEQATHDRIKDLLPEGTVGDLTRIVLANATCFRGQWRHPFRRAQTKETDFFLADGGTVKVPMMSDGSAGDVAYAAFQADGALFHTPAITRRDADPARSYPVPGGFAMVEIPYRAGRFSMVVIAPDRPDGLAAIEAMSTAETLSRWIQAGQKRPVALYLPRLRVRTEYDLNRALVSMGMTSAFREPGTPGGADFSGMNGSPEAASDLFINLVVHQAFIQVNEEGTEAAAATAVKIAQKGTTVTELMPFVPVFRADRPFLYLIRDVRTGVVLFLGRVVNPA